MALKISIILAHPDPNSFNHAIAKTAMEALVSNRHTVWFHDLYHDKFDPLLPAEELPKEAQLPIEIENYCREITGADGIVIVHPNWWGQPPAILKGWIDRVIRPGVAYEFLEEDQGEGVPNGLLKAQQALVFNTSNTETEREKQAFGDPLETLWKNCIFGLCGINAVYRRTFNIIVTSSKEQRTAWLEEVRQTISERFPVSMQKGLTDV